MHATVIFVPSRGGGIKLSKLSELYFLLIFGIPNDIVLYQWQGLLREPPRFLDDNIPNKILITEDFIQQVTYKMQVFV